MWQNICLSGIYVNFVTTKTSFWSCLQYVHCVHWPNLSSLVWLSVFFFSPFDWYKREFKWTQHVLAQRFLSNYACGYCLQFTNIYSFRYACAVCKFSSKNTKKKTWKLPFVQLNLVDFFLVRKLLQQKHIHIHD